MKPLKGVSNLRKGRYSNHGAVYHCTFSTVNNRKVFSDFENARSMISILKECDRNHFTFTYAFVIMPDHIHWLFQLKKGELSGVIKRVKSIYSWKTQTKIWNKGFYDHAIREEKDLISTARYIVANPLRAGLIDSVSDYPYWDCFWLDMK